MNQLPSTSSSLTHADFTDHRQDIYACKTDAGVYLPTKASPSDTYKTSSSLLKTRRHFKTSGLTSSSLIPHNIGYPKFYS